MKNKKEGKKQRKKFEHGDFPPKLPHNKKIDVAQALDLALRGVAQADIAKIFGVTRSAVCQALKPFRVDNPELLATYSKNKAALLNQAELSALRALTNEKLKKASAREVATVYGIFYDKNRLEQGKSNMNVNFFSRIIEMACEDERLQDR